MSDPQRGVTTFGGDYRVALIVESDVSVQSLIRTLLIRAGFCVLCARSGQAALELCRKRPVRMTVAVIEVELPDMSGKELAAALHRLRPEVQVVFVGSDAHDELLRREPPTPLLTKPFLPDELIRLVENAGVRASAAAACCCPGGDSPAECPEI